MARDDDDFDFEDAKRRVGGVTKDLKVTDPFRWVTAGNLPLTLGLAGGIVLMNVIGTFLGAPSAFDQD